MVNKVRRFLNKHFVKTSPSQLFTGHGGVYGNLQALNKSIAGSKEVIRDPVNWLAWDAERVVK